MEGGPTCGAGGMQAVNPQGHAQASYNLGGGHHASPQAVPSGKTGHCYPVETARLAMMY